ncbi:MAG: tRNA-dihydrouridine synthase, partial [Candidatus Collierbacteria bacterium GW2011_GWB1_44_6]
YTPTIEEKLMVAVEQSRKYEEFFNGRYDSSNFQFFPMRKHLACYARGFEGSSSLRKRLMTAENSEQVETMVEEFLRAG